MRISTLAGFLIGRRQAILEIAGNPRAVWAALLLVATGALARTYDRVSLVHEPFRLLGPFVATLLIGGLLFVISNFSQFGDRAGFATGKRFLTFITLYWMTAPMAWLYAIPYERFLDSYQATQANLWTLALVSVWRVLLFSRVMSVIMGIGMFSALVLTLFVGNIAAFASVFIFELPMPNMMGGIDLDESLTLTRHLVGTMFFFSFLTLPILGIISLLVLFRMRIQWIDADTLPPAKRGRGAVTLALLMLAVFIGLAVRFQPEAALAARFEKLEEERRFDEAAVLARDHAIVEFPAHWRPKTQSLEKLMTLLDSAENAGGGGWLITFCEEGIIARVLDKRIWSDMGDYEQLNERVAKGTGDSAAWGRIEETLRRRREELPEHVRRLLPVLWENENAEQTGSGNEAEAQQGGEPAHDPEPQGQTP